MIDTGGVRSKVIIEVNQVAATTKEINLFDLYLDRICWQCGGFILGQRWVYAGGYIHKPGDCE